MTFVIFMPLSILIVRMKYAIMRGSEKEVRLCLSDERMN